MVLQDVLRLKGTEVHTIGPSATLDAVVEELVHYNVGSLVVCEQNSKGGDVRMIGIITERDILRTYAVYGGSINEVPVAKVMSTDVITAQPDHRLDDAMRLMTENRIRHLPVVSDTGLQGMISIGDVVKSHHDTLEVENYYMRSYIRGEGAELATPPEAPPVSQEQPGG